MHSLWDVLDDDAQELVRRHAAAKSLAELLRTTVNTRKGEFEWIERRLSPRLRGRWLVSRTTPNPTSRDSCTLHLDLSVPVGLGYLSTVMGPSNLWKVTRDFSRAAGLEFTPRADEIFGSTSMAHSVFWIKWQFDDSHKGAPLIREHKRCKHFRKRSSAVRLACCWAPSQCLVCALCLD